MATATSSRTCPVDYVLFPVPPKLMLSLLLFPMQPAVEARHRASRPLAAVRLAWQQLCRQARLSSAAP